MNGQSIEADYLIVGAGATGMAFADTLISESQATMALVDRQHKPGGHWNDAYPFVRLHQPSAFYGVSSRPLGSSAEDKVGLNKGFEELASGQEVLSYFDQVMQQRFLPSGRVQYFPMSDVEDDRSVTSLLSGEQRPAKANKLVDARYLQPSVPSARPPRYAVAPGIICVPPNELPRIAHSHAAYVVIGAGKTGMDACLWLLENGADPDQIRWIVPRDFWLLNRGNIQPGSKFFPRTARSLADQVEALAEAQSIDEVFARLEACEEFRRIDGAVMPTGYHCAVISDAELERLRTIRNVVRLGHVTRIETQRIILERGAVATNRDCLHIDCSASALPTKPPKPVFSRDRITLQFVRQCQPVFSAAFIAHVELAYRDEPEKNRICSPIPAPDVPADWLRMMSTELANRRNWSENPELGDWIAGTRLDFFTKQTRSLTGTETDVIEHLQRFKKYAAPAAANVDILLANGLPATNAIRFAKSADSVADGADHAASSQLLRPAR